MEERERLLIPRALVGAGPAAVAVTLAVAVAFAQSEGPDSDAATREAPLELPTLRVEAVREQLREIGERWREAPEPSERWRERDEVDRPGRIVWGYDSVHEMRRVEREWLDPDPHPELSRTRPVTVLNIRF